MAKTEAVEQQVTSDVKTLSKDPAVNGKAVSKENNEPAANPGGSVGSDRTQDEKVPSIRRLWFVRMPKPPETASVKALELEVETYKAQLRLVIESVNVKQLERDAIRAHVRTARDTMKQCREAYDAKFAEVEPLRDALRSGGAASRKMREQFGDLEARSEAELNAKISALNNRIEHETIPLSEEKAIIASIKKLQAQRPRVQEYEATVGVAIENRGDVDRIRAESSEHEAELKVLRTEKDTQGAILAKFIEQESAVNAEVQSAIEEKKRIKELQDGAFARLAEARNAQRSRTSDFFSNRRFSRTVRGAVAAGDVEKALDMCSKQSDEAIAKLASDAAFRKEYLAMWDQQRSAAASADAEFPSSSDTGNSGNAHGKGRRQAKDTPAVEPAVKAQAVIAAVLEEARLEKAKADVIAAAAPVPIVAHATADAQTNGNGVHVAPLVAPKAAKKATAPKYVPEPVVEPEDKFELPAVMKQKQASSSIEATASDKKAERERNRIAQEEAEAKRARRELEKARRKEKAAKAAAEQEAAAAAALAKAAATAAAHASRTASDEIEAAADITEGGADKDDNVSPAQLAKNAKVPLPVAKALAPRPLAKRPVRRTTMRQFLLALEGNATMVAMALAVALIVILVSRFFAADDSVIYTTNEW